MFHIIKKVYQNFFLWKQIKIYFFVGFDILKPCQDWVFNEYHTFLYVIFKFCFYIFVSFFG